MSNLFAAQFRLDEDMKKLDIDAEYALIQQRKSRLSSLKRREVVRRYELLKAGKLEVAKSVESGIQGFTHQEQPGDAMLLNKDKGFFK